MIKFENLFPDTICNNCSSRVIRMLVLDEDDFSMEELEGFDDSEASMNFKAMHHICMSLNIDLTCRVSACEAFKEKRKKLIDEQILKDI